MLKVFQVDFRELEVAVKRLVQQTERPVFGGTVGPKETRPVLLEQTEYSFVAFDHLAIIFDCAQSIIFASAGGGERLVQGAHVVRLINQLIGKPAA